MSSQDSNLRSAFASILFGGSLFILAFKFYEFFPNYKNVSFFDVLFIFFTFLYLVGFWYWSFIFTEKINYKISLLDWLISFIFSGLVFSMCYVSTPFYYDKGKS
jgi:hypothetical protein